MTVVEIAKSFSNGDFEKTFDFIAEDALWTVVEENEFAGKNAIIDQCKQVGNYFKTVETDFKTLHVIADQNKVAINGTATFLKDGKQLSYVSACDVYEFNENHQIKNITSYCIQAK